MDYQNVYLEKTIEGRFLVIDMIPHSIQSVICAINSHEVLLEALKALVNEIGEGSKVGKYLSSNTWELIENAIAQAEGK